MGQGKETVMVQGKKKELDLAALARFRDMTETPVPQLITRLSVPTIISMLVTAIYNAADTFFVGRISTEATAAVGLAFSAMAVIQALGFFCGQGSGNYLSRMLGAGKQEEAEQMAATGLALSMILGVLVAAGAILNIRQLSAFLGASGTTVEETVRYLRIIVIGAPFMMGQFVINNQLRYQGSAMYAMVGLLCGAILNIFLDPLLIFVFRMGVAGAALATISGQMISFFVLLLGSMQGANRAAGRQHAGRQYPPQCEERAAERTLPGGDRERRHSRSVPAGTGGSCDGAFESGGWRLRGRGHRRDERHHPRRHVRLQRADRFRAGLPAGVLL